MGTSSQRGYVTPRGKKWYGYFRKTVIDPTTAKQKTVRVAVILGHRSQMKRSQAREALEREITKQNGQTGDAGRVMNDGSVSFGWFVRNRFLPLKEANWKEETSKVKKLLIQKDLIDPFDKIPLENFDKFTLQVHLNKLAQTRSRDRVLQMRAYLRDIFVEAVDQDFLSKDPARKVRVPAQLRETDKTTLSWEQLRKALSRLDLRDRLLLELDMTNALRPSELFALRWKCFNLAESNMSVSETAYMGKIRPWGKTRKSLGVIHIPRKLTADLWRWKQQCPDPTPEAFIFPNQDGDFIDTGNYRKRVLHKLAAELELPKLTFQVIRRTIATLAQKKGTVKDVQGVLRHSRAATTTDVYMQEIPKSVRATVDSINKELRKRSTSVRKQKASVVNGGLTTSQFRRSQSVLTPNDTNRLVGTFVSD
ncbi:MAG TPA: tyrosine-type recombinase/integrase [Candidatus Sulfotelmatobacter sp.]|nr:tyrosine-type recombinase/integrase [Candidatus Sulfotelmatobacter sp.]